MHVLGDVKLTLAATVCEFAHGGVQWHRTQMPNPPTTASQQVAPAGTQLKRRRAWDLFLGAPGGSAAVLVVSKKSIFSLEDAQVALGIMNEETAARRLDVRQLLLTTRAGVAPSAEAFLKGAQASLLDPSSDGDAGVVAVLRWEQCQQLVRDGTLSSYLATSGSRRRDGSSSVPKAPPSFALPAWLLEERERGMGAVFDLHSPFEPAGDQPEAIRALSRGLEEGKRHQTLLGATGTVRCPKQVQRVCVYLASHRPLVARSLSRATGACILKHFHLHSLGGLHAQLPRPVLVSRTTPLVSLSRRVKR